MLHFLISTLIRQEGLGFFNKIISDESERFYFPASQILFYNALQFDITYKKAYFTFPILENFVYSFYYDTIYGLGLGYKFNKIDVGFNGFYIGDKINFNVGSNFSIFDKHQIKLSVGYIKDSFEIRGFFKIASFEQGSFRFYGEYRNTFNGILAISYEPTIYRFLTFGISNIDTTFYAFSNVEFFIYREYLMLRGGVWQNLKTKDYNMIYGFSVSYNNIRGDFIINEKEFKIGIYYAFKIF